MANTNATVVGREIANLKAQYALTLETLLRRGNEAKDKICDGRTSTHDAFNMSATCQELAVLAGKIEANEAILRAIEQGALNG